MRPSTYRTYATEDIQYMRDHRYDNPKQVAEVLGESPRTIDAYMRRIRNGTFCTKVYPNLKYYALYLRKTDELVCCGSAKECANELGIAIHSFYGMVHKILSGKIKKWDVYVESYNVNEE